MRFWIDPTDKCGGLRILDLRFGIDSTDKSGGLYHQEIRLSEHERCSGDPKTRQ
ncbi:hypothetical protein [Microcoleus sp. Pol8_C1]|uniref:hypothetical protein n=1 Tax=Microcoleus sp. Pol8_C1 TaxID=2818896 RepID=UPI002FD5D6F5